MKCPKCNKTIRENETICPHCKKVLVLECPNCHSHSQNAICDTCGYVILTKCIKCSRTISTQKESCRCGYPTVMSLVQNECESDEFASIVLNFASLKKIRKILGTQDLFSKFYFKLKNILTIQLKNFDGHIISYNDTFVLNFNKELSFATSCDKATRLALKIINAFSDLNLKVLNEFNIPLKLTILIVQKRAEQLLELPKIESNVKLLSVKQDEKKYLRGIQLVLDQYVQDCINKHYKTDSLYAIESEGKSIMYYELLLDSYVLPPEDNDVVVKAEVPVQKTEIKKIEQETEEDLFSYNIFEIDALCKFKKTNAESFFKDFEMNTIVSIRADKEYGIDTAELVKHIESLGYSTLKVTCTEEMSYKPWGILEQLFRDYHSLPFCNSLIKSTKVDVFQSLMELVLGVPRNATSSEDARFAYMEDFGAFLSSLKGYTVIIDGFEYMDDTTIQTFELFFDRFKKLNVNFIFITNSQTSLHSKIKGLLRTTLYTEYYLYKTSMEFLVLSIKEEASDFIKSFYFEKIKENCKGSSLYFKHAMKYLFENDILFNFENRLLIKNKRSVLLAPNLQELIRARLKLLSKQYSEASLILAYSFILGARIDIGTLSQLGVKDVDKNIAILEQRGFIYKKFDIIYVNNYNLLKLSLNDSLKPEVISYLAKNILANIGKELDDATTALTLGKISKFKEEYLVLWKNSQLSIAMGDYDAYLQNCLGFLSLLDFVGENISKEDIENNKKEVYENILMSLYAYAPDKIYSIENVLLMDAINEGDNEKIVKLSNLMLQGALLSSNYKDALSLLHNILTRMPDSTLLVDGAVNTKFLLLSLVNIEILFNIGDYAQCIEVGKDILSVLNPEIIDKIKPPSFSTNLFVTHLLETFRLVILAKLFMADDDIETYFSAIKEALNTELPEKECIMTIRDFWSGKEFLPSNISGSPAFAKVIYLIMQEFSLHINDIKTFAKNIHQAKLLAIDIHQVQLEYLCDLLIGYSYARSGISSKAAAIYDDVLNKAQNSSIFNIIMLANYFKSLLLVDKNEPDEALRIINDSLGMLQNYSNKMFLFYVLFEKLLVDLCVSENIEEIDINSEKQKLALIAEDGKFARFFE